MEGSEKTLDEDNIDKPGRDDAVDSPNPTRPAASVRLMVDTEG